MSLPNTAASHRSPSRLAGLAGLVLTLSLAAQVAAAAAPVEAEWSHDTGG